MGKDTQEGNPCLEEVSTPTKEVSETVLQTEKILLWTVIFFAGLIAGLILAKIGYIGSITRPLANDQWESFVIQPDASQVAMVSDTESSVSTLISFDSTKQVVKVDVGAELPMYVGHTRQMSEILHEGEPQLTAVDSRLVFALVESKIMSQRYYKIPPSPEYIETEEQFLQANAEVLQ